MSKSKEHLVCVRIETLDPQGLSAARDRFRRWLETYGHTSPSHGFDFVYVVGDSSNKTVRRQTQ